MDAACFESLVCFWILILEMTCVFLRRLVVSSRGDVDTALRSVGDASWNKVMHQWRPFTSAEVDLFFRIFSRGDGTPYEFFCQQVFFTDYYFK